MFPLESAKKTDVLAALAGMGITAPQPKESQEVCFVPGDEYRDFVLRMAQRWGISLPGPGPVLLRDGQSIGTHEGLWRYTEGQRKGIGIGWKEPLHVLGKEVGDNVLRLGTREEMRVSSCECEDVNLLLPPEYWPETVLVKIRYRETPQKAHVRVLPGRPGEAPGMRIFFCEPKTAAAPGQIAAVYVPASENLYAEGPDAAPLRLAAGGVITTAFAV
jgi:tRNA-specific 2-thiouridylase